MCLGVNRHLVSGHEISRLQHGLQLIMARYTRILRACCNLYIISYIISHHITSHQIIYILLILYTTVHRKSQYRFFLFFWH